MDLKKEQEKIRVISWWEIKETASQKQIPSMRKSFCGSDFKQAFDKLYDSALHVDDNFMDEDQNPLWKPVDDGLELDATDKELFDLIQDWYFYDITIEDSETEIAFDVDNCTINWKNKTFTVNYLTDENEEELEEYYLDN